MTYVCSSQHCCDGEMRMNGRPFVFPKFKTEYIGRAGISYDADCCQLANCAYAFVHCAVKCLSHFALRSQFFWFIHVVAAAHDMPNAFKRYGVHAHKHIGCVGRRGSRSVIAYCATHDTWFERGRISIEYSSENLVQSLPVHFRNAAICNLHEVWNDERKICGIFPKDILLCFLYTKIAGAFNISILIRESRIIYYYFFVHIPLNDSHTHQNRYRRLKRQPHKAIEKGTGIGLGDFNWKLRKLRKLLCFEHFIIMKSQRLTFGITESHTIWLLSNPYVRALSTLHASWR